jgi:hypothetical protein
MDARSRRKPRPGADRDPAPTPATPDATPATPDADALRAGYARGRERDAEIREGLEPLAPGERPGAVTIAALLALALAVANVIAALTVELSDAQESPVAFTAVTTAILLACAVGMWRAWYQAVLAFQVLIGFQVVIYSLALTRVQKWWLALLLVVIVGLLGWLFWKLIRAMARLQMPARPAAPASDTHR